MTSLETVYREAYARADQAGNKDEMARLDLEYQRDQLYLEGILDVRELLDRGVAADAAAESSESLLEKAQAVRKLVKGR